MATSGSDGSEGGDGGSENRDEGQLLPKLTGPVCRGKCKWFNVAKGFGFITPDEGGQDVFVHQTLIRMKGFRSLEENEEVEFQYKDSDKGREATGVQGTNEEKICTGSKRRPRPKYKRKSNKCYNCGKQGHHAKDCPLPQQPKLCHRCQSDQHLIADCPEPPEPTQGNGSKKAEGGKDSDGSGDEGGDEAGAEAGATGENGHS